MCSSNLERIVEKTKDGRIRGNGFLESQVGTVRVIGDLRVDRISVCYIPLLCNHDGYKAE